MPESIYTIVVVAASEPPAVSVTGVGRGRARPPRRRRIDPTTMDYVLERGAHQEDDGALSHVMLALATKRGSSAVYPDFGCRLHEIRKMTSDVPRFAREYVVEALRHLTDRKDVRDLKVVATISGTRLDVQVSYLNRAGQRTSLELSSAL